MKKKMALAGVAGVVLSSAVLAAPAAQAAARDGVCQTGEFCLYFNSNNKGSLSDFTTSISNYGAKQPGCYEFRGAGAGRLRCVKNQAASVWNRTPKPVTVYFNSGYKGATQVIPAGGKANLSAKLKNQNAGHRLSTSGTGPAPGTGTGPAPGTGGGSTSNGGTSLSSALYGTSGGRITAGFDGYRNTSGRHEGIDIARRIGSPVHALVAGKVTYVARGKRGRSSRSNLSTIAIYNATYKKTVVYLHSAPVSSLKVGQTIRLHQRIASEDWRGVSSSSSAHTHVELRNGRVTHAAVSVGDNRLDNPNPTSFWRARGYAIK